MAAAKPLNSPIIQMQVKNCSILQCDTYLSNHFDRYSEKLHLEYG